MNLPKIDAVEVWAPLWILGFLLMLFVVILYRAQVNPNIEFDTANFLKDEQGKESSTRLFSFIALAIHSWWVATLVLQKAATENHFLYYGLIWAGTPAVMKIADKWAGNLPFAQAPQSAPAQPVDESQRR